MPRGARVRVDVRVTACACSARARARIRARAPRVCVHAALGAPRTLRFFFWRERKTLRFLLRGLVWNVDDQQREASDVQEKAISETVYGC